MPDRGDELVQQRLAKLQYLRDNHVDPYPPRFHRTHSAQEARSFFETALQGAADPAKKLTVAGRITALRSHGKSAFLDLKDGSGRIQVYLRQDRAGEEQYALLKGLDLGDFLGATGHLFRTHSGEITLEAASITILCKALRTLPEKWHGLEDIELRYRQRYLDLIASDESKHIFEVRSKVVAGIRKYLSAQGFIEAETPILWPVAGGATARPFATYHNALDRQLFLRIALELHLKRLIVGGFDKVYEIGRVFRNEGIDITHNPEFTLMESYEAYADYQDVMKRVEVMVTSVAQEVLGTLQVKYGDHVLDLSPPWCRVDLKQALFETSGIDIDAYPDAPSLAEKMRATGVRTEVQASRGKLLDKLISTFVEPTLIQPTFLVDYPVEMSPLAKRKPGNPAYVERFEGFAAGTEIANSFSELNDPVDQRERFYKQERLRQALSDEDFDRLDEDFLTAMEYGMPPTGGLGMGIDRLVMLFTNQQSIREVIFFPQLRSK